jgi:hypothetical protein
MPSLCNLSDIDASKVVWAREMRDAYNLKLVRFYRDRKVWLVEPEVRPATVSQYPVSTQLTADSR